MSSLRALLGLGSVATLLGACIFVGGSKQHKTDDTGWPTTTNTTGTTSSSTSTTSTTTGTGGGGGACVDGTGTGQTDAVCDELQITPVSHGGPASMCGAAFDLDPLGHASCHGVFPIWKSGQAEDLVDCLALIGVQDACQDQLVQDCVSEVYDAACDDPFIGETCQGIADVCGADPFDAAGCSFELNVFSVDGVNLVIDCINALDPSISCQAAYDDCFDQVTSL